MGARRGSLFRKYAMVFVGLVAGSLLVSDLIQAYLSYRDKNESVLSNAQNSAATAASTIERFMAETTAQLGGMVQYAPASLSDRDVRAGSRPQEFALLGNEMWVANYVDGTVSRLPIK